MTAQGPCTICNKPTGFYSYEQPVGWYCAEHRNDRSKIPGHEQLPAYPERHLNRQQRRALAAQSRKNPPVPLVCTACHTEILPGEKITWQNTHAPTPGRTAPLTEEDKKTVHHQVCPL